jgi:hypothetical protein
MNANGLEYSSVASGRAPHGVGPGGRDAVMPSQHLLFCIASCLQGTMLAPAAARGSRRPAATQSGSRPWHVLVEGCGRAGRSARPAPGIVAPASPRASDGESSPAKCAVEAAGSQRRLRAGWSRRSRQPRRSRRSRPGRDRHARPSSSPPHRDSRRSRRPRFPAITAITVPPTPRLRAPCG